MSGGCPRVPTQGRTTANVLKSYSPDMIRLNQRGIRATRRPSGHNITKKFNQLDPGGAIPGNVIETSEADDLLRFGNNAANDAYTKHCTEAGHKVHPASVP